MTNIISGMTRFAYSRRDHLQYKVHTAYITFIFCNKISIFFTPSLIFGICRHLVWSEMTLWFDSASANVSSVNVYGFEEREHTV